MNVGYLTCHAWNPTQSEYPCDRFTLDVRFVLTDTGDDIDNEWQSDILCEEHDIEAQTWDSREAHWERLTEIAEAWDFHWCNDCTEWCHSTHDCFIDYNEEPGEDIVWVGSRRTPPTISTRWNQP